MHAAVVVSVLAATAVQGRFNQEKTPIDSIERAVKGFGKPGDVGNLVGGIPTVLLASTDPCAKLEHADKMVAMLGKEAAVVQAAAKLVAAEKNFNPFVVSLPAMCGDAKLPATPELRGIIPLVDPGVVGAEVENANSNESITCPFEATGMSVADVMKAHGFSNFTVNGKPASQSVGTVPATTSGKGPSASGSGTVRKRQDKCGPGAALLSGSGSAGTGAPDPAANATTTRSENQNSAKTAPSPGPKPNGMSKTGPNSGASSSPAPASNNMEPGPSGSNRGTSPTTAPRPETQPNGTPEPGAKPRGPPWAAPGRRATRTRRHTGSTELSASVADGGTQVGGEAKSKETTESKSSGGDITSCGAAASLGSTNTMTGSPPGTQPSNNTAPPKMNIVKEEDSRSDTSGNKGPDTGSNVNTKPTTPTNATKATGQQSPAPPSAGKEKAGTSTGNTGAGPSAMEPGGGTGKGAGDGSDGKSGAAPAPKTDAVDDPVTGTFGGFAASSKGLDFGRCVPTVKYEESLSGRKAGERAYQAQDPTVNRGQQEALNPNIIFQRVCDQLVNVCGAARDAVDECRRVQKSLAAGARDAALAERWNAELGFEGVDINPDKAPKQGLVGHT